MPVRIAHAADLERWHTRRVVPSLLCAIATTTFSCQGDCVGIDGTASTRSTLAVHARYVLVRFDGQMLPAPLADAGTVQLRLLADTLLFSGTGTAASGTYTEIVVVGTTRGTAAETVTRTMSSSRPWTRVQPDQLSLSTFGGGATATAATATLAELTTSAQLAVNTSDGRSYVFEGR